MFSLTIKSKIFNDKSMYYYSTRDLALQDSVYYMQNYINIAWNHDSDIEWCKRAKEINDYVLNQDYSLAFHFFHVYESLGPNDIDYTIENCTIATSALVPDLYDYIIQESNSDKLDPVKFGANCIKCNYRSEYAPDNGAYVCHQCTYFNQVFSLE